MGGIRRRVLAALLIGAGLLAGCGKKGPPIAPRVRIPAGVEEIAAARLGNEVYVTLTVPATNIDGSVPLDLGRIDLYGYTGRTPPSRARWAELGRVVGSLTIDTPPDTSAAAPGTLSGAGVLPGSAVTIRDVLSAGDFVEGPLPPADPRRPDLAPPLPVSQAAPLPLRRFYVAIPFSTRGRNGPPGGQATLLLAPPPEAPSAVRVSYDASRVSLAWEPSGGLFGFLLNRALPPEPPPFVAAPQPAPLAPRAAGTLAEAAPPVGPTTYNVYRHMAPDPLELPPSVRAPDGSTAPPEPLNAAPIAATSAEDELMFGRQRCYVVRARRGDVFSEPSPPACVMPVDVFPPAAPAGLAAVASEGGITLLWEPNGEPDLGGYLVLRRQPGDATLRQLTERPISEARYRDATVESGTRYIYSVVAVDARLPLPNVSPESERVEETAP